MKLDFLEKFSDKFSIQKTIKFIEKFPNLNFIDDLKLLFEMITDKEYKLDKKTYLIIAGAIAYVVVPTDFIPDFIFGIGFIDDAFVIGAVFNQLKNEIEKYKKFKNK